jgi:hypothetical protein
MAKKILPKKEDYLRQGRREGERAGNFYRGPEERNLRFFRSYVAILKSSLDEWGPEKTKNSLAEGRNFLYRGPNILSMALTYNSNSPLVSKT